MFNLVIMCEIAVACNSSDTVKPHKRPKRVPNRPLRSKPKEQPDKSLSLSSIREHQLDDEVYRPFLNGKRTQTFQSQL